jgi:hypothetical protein
MDAGRGLSGREQLLDAAFGLAVTAVAVASVVTDDPAVASRFPLCRLGIDPASNCSTSTASSQTCRSKRWPAR